MQKSQTEIDLDVSALGLSITDRVIGLVSSYQKVISVVMALKDEIAKLREELKRKEEEIASLKLGDVNGAVDK